MPGGNSERNPLQNRPLNIWWISHYASTPDQQFTTQYDLARRLVEKGHRVTFFSAGFSHYKFEEIRLKASESWRAEDHDGVRFIWIKTPPYKKNDWRRALNICSFAFRTYWVARKVHETPDVIIGTTFHPLASLSAYGISLAKGRPFVYEVKDLWPLTMIQFGRLSPENPVAWILSLLEKFLARRAARIMTTLPGAADHYAQIGVLREKAVWIPNGLEISRYTGLKPYDGKPRKPFVLMYAGGLVSANALETIVRAASLEQEHADDEVKFVFLGGGQEKPRLMRLAGDLGLHNVEFRDAVPKTELHKALEEADAFILSMRNLPGLYKYGMSFNKLCDYAASGRPVLFAGYTNGNLVEEFGFGIVVPPEDPQAFFAAIQEFKNMSAAQRAEMGANGIRCARERFDITVLAGRLEGMLKAVVNDFQEVSEPFPQPAAGTL